MAYIDKINNNFENEITLPIIIALEKEENILNEEVENTRKQFFLDDATWGVDKWEKMLGIKPNNLDLDTRKENIKAIMRARGTSTLNQIKSICEAYSNGEVDIIVDHANYFFTVDFIGTIGVPKALDQLKIKLDELKPAHLGYKFKFNYNTNKDLSKFTHEQLAKYTHDELRNSPELRGGN